MNLLMLKKDGSLSLRRFAVPDAVWDMGMLALAAGSVRDCCRRLFLPSGLAGQR
jgi:hypothetical protein